MKINLPIGLLAVAVVLFAGGILAEAEEVIVLALFAAAASVFGYIAVLRGRVESRESPGDVERRLNELERRLGLTEGELDVANDQLQRFRAEREFDRALELGRAAVPDAGRVLHPR